MTREVIFRQVPDAFRAAYRVEIKQWIEAYEMRRAPEYLRIMPHFPIEPGGWSEALKAPEVDIQIVTLLIDRGSHHLVVKPDVGSEKVMTNWCRKMAEAA